MNGSAGSREKVALPPSEIEMAEEAHQRWVPGEVVGGTPKETYQRGRRLAVWVTSLLAVAGVVAVLSSPTARGRVVQSIESMRRTQVVDLSYDENLPEIRTAPPAKPINLIELEESHEDYEHGTHEIVIGHGGVEFA